MTKAPFAALDLAAAAVTLAPLPGGGMILSSPQALAKYPGNLCAHLRRWAQETPDRIFLADRTGPDGGWRTVTYAQTWRRAKGIGQALLDRGITPDNPVMCLSDNSLDNGLLMLGTIYAGLCYCPVSPSYSLFSTNFLRLKHIFAQVRPKLIYAADGGQFTATLGSLDLGGVEVVNSHNHLDGATIFSTLAATTPGIAVLAGQASVGPNTAAKILYTSGSTGLPKGVINTHRMLCSNQQTIAQTWPFVTKKPPVILDWLPWNHTFGGNHNFNLVLRNGGTLYVDNGKPAPGLIARTVANLAEVSPTIYFNVPRGFDMLLPYLEADDDLRDRFFKNLDLIFYAAAGLPQNLWDRLEDLSVAATGARVVMTSGWGATETGPMATNVHFPIERAGVIGNPAPGTEIKMVPNGEKLELRVRGPQVTPGYFKDPEKTAEAFDDDGFYKTGDAGRLEDPDDPARGIVFDGRIAEDFKLASGTWVAVGALRLAVIGAAPAVIQDAVVTGHDRDEIGLLIFPNPVGLGSLCPDAPADAPLVDLIARAEVIAALQTGLAAHNQSQPASSTRIARVFILDKPPAIDANEITDKAYLNQRAVLEARAPDVAALYDDGPGVLRID